MPRDTSQSIFSLVFFGIGLVYVCQVGNTIIMPAGPWYTHILQGIYVVCYREFRKYRGFRRNAEGWWC